MTDRGISALEWRDEFVTLLSSAVPEDWERARALKLSKVPDHLYRYYAVNENSLKGLLGSTVWLSAASNFNDLHDTSADFDAIDFVEASLRKGLEDGSLGLPPEMKDFLPPVANDMIGAFDAFLAAEVEKQAGPEAAARAKDFYKNFTQKQSREMSAIGSKFLQQRTKVGCFCEAGDEPLLWAHYADRHRGFCVEYPIKDLPRDDLRLRWLLPVVYGARKFSLSGLVMSQGGKPHPQMVWLASIHKAPYWAYEREWRIVDTVGDRVPGREILMPKPSGVFLGHRMSEETRALVTEIASKQGIPIFKMGPSSEGFGLHAEPVSTG